MRSPVPNASHASYWQRSMAITLVVTLLGAACASVAPAPTAAPPTQPPAATSAPAATAAATVAGMEMAPVEPCTSVSNVSMLETPVPVTPRAPTVTPQNFTPPAPPPTVVPGPAPKQDRVGFPKDYQTNFKLFYVFDRPDNKQVRVVCGNDKAVSIKPGEAFPYGSILVMETWRTKQDAQGEAVKDAKGHYIRESLAGIFVMRKEQGFGVDYQHLRTGEWEYVAFRPDGTYQTKPEGTFTCATCHQVGSNKESDWTFRKDLFFKADRYGTPVTAGPNAVLMSSITFSPRRLKVKVGTPVTWVNADAVEHTVVMQDGSLASPVIKPGETYTYTFATTGVFTYSCGIHPRHMINAAIEVTN